MFCTKASFWSSKDNGSFTGSKHRRKGTQNGVSTDMDGSYKIKVKDGATLIFSYVGYAKVEKQPQKEL
jgi:iron complex outermembrane receptor protein